MDGTIAKSALAIASLFGVTDAPMMELVKAR